MCLLFPCLSCQLLSDRSPHYLCSKLPSSRFKKLLKKEELPEHPRPFHMTVSVPTFPLNPQLLGSKDRLLHPGTGQARQARGRHWWHFRDYPQADPGSGDEESGLEPLRLQSRLLPALFLPDPRGPPRRCGGWEKAGCLEGTPFGSESPKGPSTYFTEEELRPEEEMICPVPCCWNQRPDFMTFGLKTPSPVPGDLTQSHKAAGEEHKCPARRLAQGRTHRNSSVNMGQC